MTILGPLVLGQLAEAAVSAPSADNRHVFRLRAAGDGTLEVHARAGLNDGPAGRRLLGLMSVGAALESMVLRAGRLGFSAEVLAGSDRPGDGLLAALRLQPAVQPGIDPLEGFIAARHSNRRLRFRGPGLPEAARSAMAAEAARLPGTSLIWLDEPASRRRALRLIRTAETERFCNEALHRELFESVRFDIGWQRTAAEGLPPAALELPPPERPMFSMLRHWPVQRVANLMLVHRFIGFRAADLPCRLAPHLCAIGAGSDPERGALVAGRLLQRTWLHAQRLGLSVQVFAASCLYAFEGAMPVSARLQRTLADGWRELVPSGRPYLILRMGFAAPPTLRAGRPPAASLLEA